ncbi:hypothetical protein [Streptacidiphilus fuscans]|uniref:Secreted protein n=1 Tax=Streptacidiphilus fuscans TaxID=2789292 RepID=A0A931B1F9_9ACTN|nr:hypothetical protein [Streptacidiphilus fuscans]MBF9066957.1 hypothetical protein [Streptacidiphilus fuscans]
MAGTVRDGARGKRGLLVATGALAAALCLTACGGSAKQPAAPSATAGSPSTAVSTKPVSKTAGTVTPTPSAIATSPSSAAPTSSGPSAAPQPGSVAAVIDDCLGKPVPQPGDIVLTCADAGWVLEHLKWTGWGQPTASASGLWSEKNCTPNCATGGVSTYPVTVTVSSLRGTTYTRMYLTAPTSPTPKATFALTSKGPSFVSGK